MLTGAQLIEDINSFSDSPAAWWLGQQGFVFKLAGRVVYVDAFLSPHPRRQVPPLLNPAEVTNADVVIGTHDHADHIDRKSWPGIAAASPKAKFVVPAAHLPKLATDLGIDASRFVAVDDLKTVEVAGIRLTGIAAAHELLSPDAAGRYPFLGVVIEVDVSGVADVAQPPAAVLKAKSPQPGAAGLHQQETHPGASPSSGQAGVPHKPHRLTLYHAGDSCIYEGLVTKLKRWDFDAVFLPINGRDAARLRANIIGNMTYQEAADLAGALRPRLTVPAHFEMFAANSCDVQLFLDYMQVKYPRLATHLPVHGQRFDLLAR